MLEKQAIALKHILMAEIRMEKLALGTCVVDLELMKNWVLDEGFWTWVQHICDPPFDSCNRKWLAG